MALVELGELDNELSDDARKTLAEISTKIDTLMDLDDIDRTI